MSDAGVIGVRFYKNFRIELRTSGAGAGVYALIRAPGAEAAARRVACEAGTHTLVGLLRLARAEIDATLAGSGADAARPYPAAPADVSAIDPLGTSLPTSVTASLVGKRAGR